MSNTTAFLPALPFNCSFPGCTADVSDDFCAMHIPAEEIETIDEDDADECYACGYAGCRHE